MKLQLISDLHGHSLKKVPALTNTLVVAGDHNDDMGRLATDLNAATKRWRNVLFVPGNHEFYRGLSHKWHYRRYTLEQTIAAFLSFMDAECEATVLFNDVALIDAHRFYGTPLFTDWSSNWNAAEFSRNRINDFRFIPGADINSYVSQFETACEFLRPVTSSDVVITHWAPVRTRETINATFPPSGLDYYFHNHLAHPRPALWMFGHTHHNCDFELDGTRFVSNQANTADLNKVIEL